MNDIPFWSLILLGLVSLLLVRGLFLPTAKRVAKTAPSRAVLSFVSDRERNGWLFLFGFWSAVVIHPAIALILFASSSFLGLREFLTRSPANGADYKALFVSFFILLPCQYLLIGFGWQWFFTVFIPVYAFFLLPSLSALSGDTKEFFARAAKLQLGMMLAVYGISHIPASMMLIETKGNNHAAYMMLFLMVTSQVADIVQYAVSRRYGKRKIARSVARDLTLEGVAAGVVAAIAAGLSLYWAVPFNWNSNVGVSIAVALSGFLGHLVLSGIRKSTGIRDWGEAIDGRSSVLDRMASLCFSAPLFYHLSRSVLAID